METSRFVRFFAQGFIFCLAVTTLAFAQVVTPSLDPTAPVYFPAAAGWKKVAVVGAGGFERIGTRELDEQNIYEFAGSGYAAHLNFTMGERIAFEGYGYSHSITVKKDQTYTGAYNLERSETRGVLTLSHEEFAVFGIGLHMLKNTDFLTIQEPEVESNRQATIPSLSIKMGEHFYFGGGIERVSQTSSYEVDNHWTDTTFGLAFQAGSPESSMFRIEYSITNSPESTSSAKSGKVASTHPKTVTSRANAELKVKGLIFTAGMTDIKQSVDLINENTQEEVDQVHIVIGQFGVLLAPKGGLTLGFMFESEKVTEVFSDSFETFRMNLAYSFGE